MNRRTKLRAQIALTTAVCFGSLATLAAGSPSRAGEPCEQPVWSQVVSWAANDCR